ncbi:DUF2637 domain-containing protein [Nocardiopsis sp. RSe5-2]|uniref:DUF2637 domain-containing protein n=1 Tax=Nocardiopsis endophytica TaxID=3018445 RepID=A0ABT4U1G6_9ACTN|nr:DUF2637 domain-containing protein [Nocardiopsis endophytica]MDA2810793.1 DUF2637 domain-containing protein [Nocardiopsis endophytica]
MAVKPSSSPASPARRRPGTRPAPTGGPQGPRGPRTAAVLLTAAGVLLIAACAVVLSYSGIYQLALQGNVPADRAHLYPGVFTLLLLLAFWASFLLRAAPRPQRLQVDGLILLLILAAAGASALSASEQRPSDALAVVLAAAAPWLALLVAFLLFIRVWRYLNGELPDRRARRRPHPAAAGDPAGSRDEDVEDEDDGRDDDDRDPEDEGPEEAEAAAAGPADATADGAAEEPEEERAPEPTLLWPRAGARRTASAESTALSANDEDTDPVSAVRVLHASGPSVREQEEDERGEEADEEREEAPDSPEEPDEPAALREVPAPDSDEDDVEEDEADEDGDAAAAPASSVITSPTVPLRPLPDYRDGDTAGEDRPELPRRDPESGNPIKRAAEEAPSLGGAAGSGALPSEASGDDGFDDGFMDTVPADDPTSDEAAVPAEEGAEGEVPPPDADTRVYGTPPGAEPMPKRPMVLKPRRTPMADFPSEEPPASRVRSGPTPPDAPEDA